LFADAALAQDFETQKERLTLEEDVTPILASRCIKCHGGDRQESGLDLRRRFTMLTGGDSGPAIVPGKPQKSLLLEFIDDGLMPPEDEPQLTEQEIGVLRRWIASGATIMGKVEEPLPDVDNVQHSFDEAARQHWAFQPVKPMTPPAVKNSAWVTTPVDAFVLAQLEQQHWSPANAADKATLIRRVYFDLTGLPPSPTETDEFVNDESENAYETVVDRLLASHQYGERWAQHWLDVVRYAETEGFEYDRHLPEDWRFRDYVIDSLNADKPFDQFVREQIAGDEIAPGDVECQSAAIFHRLGAVRRNAGNPDIALSRNEVLTERTNIIGEAFLGLTVGCARCHNHKLEPITQKDYYRLQAYFAATQEYDIPLGTPKEKTAWDKQAAAIKKKISALKANIASLTEEQKQKQKREILKVAAEQPPHPATIPSVRNEADKRTAVHVLRRGVWEHKGVAVGPRPLSVLAAATESELPSDIANPRTQLANWLTKNRHPLTARVIVNRIWQYHFGTGLVATANDFGTHGARPSHPELLDWLANALVDNDWRFKPMHRLIVLSNTYRQSSLPHDQSAVSAVDPDNRLLSHFSRRRLSGEEIRDAMLAVSGRLNSKTHGRSVITPVDPALISLLYNPTQWIVTKDATEFDRRSIYLIAKRNLRLPFMEAFDAPALQTSCPLRGESTHAPQALELLNGTFANDMAKALGQRLKSECGHEHHQTVDRAYRLATGRAPTPREQQLSLVFLKVQDVNEFALAIFNLNDFVYVR